MTNLYDGINNSDLFKKFIVDELLFVEYTCEPGDYRTKIWSHCNYFTLVVSGKMLLKTISGEYALEKGNCYFVRRGGCIVQLFEGDAFCDMIIFITDDFIKSVVRKHQLRLRPSSRSITNDLVIPLKFDGTLISYYESLFAYFPKLDPPSKALLKVKFEELIINTLSNRSNQVLIDYISNLIATSKSSIQEIMELNYCNNLSIKEFARLCSRSLSSFRRDFKQIYGIPPGHWLREKRLAYSSLLLSATDKRIEDVIYESGFENRSHFIRVFKEKYDITPYKFREKARSREH